jgi:hypothetical protein
MALLMRCRETRLSVRIETCSGVSRDTAMAASSALLMVLRCGEDSTIMYSVRVFGITTEAPRMLELECLDPSVYVNAVLSYLRVGVEECTVEGE